MTLHHITSHQHQRDVLQQQQRREERVQLVHSYVCIRVKKKKLKCFVSWWEIATLLEVDMETCDNVKNSGEMEHR